MNKKKVISEFSELVSIQSVSPDPKRFRELLEAAEFLSEKLKSLGFFVKKYGGEKAPPLLVAKLEASQNQKKARTVGIYGHYDVQPEDPLGEWKTPPFKLSKSKGRFWGRGVSDNKGPIIQNLAAVENLIERKELNSNTIIVIEGEEESGSAHFEKFLKKALPTVSKADAFYVTDVEMQHNCTPQIFYALRGLVYFELQIKTGKKDLHSGTYGNAVLNPAQALCEILSRMKCSKTGLINIPGFYKELKKVSPKESRLLRKTFHRAKEKEEAEVFEMCYSDKKEPHLSSKARPSMDINGIFSGYTGEGAKTIIPHSATAKFSFRLVERQTPERMEKLVRRFVEKNVPKEARFKLELLGKAAPFYTPPNSPFIKSTARVLSEVFGKETLLNRDGASIPAAEILQRLLKKPVILTGFANPGCNMHAPNENFSEINFWKGIDALERIYSRD
ncbi:MAG: M20/M25/M40 family metallo-hydrolase [Candidatus Aenigmarchaeota archaeon]|nr:M20/M25/M40 family metallo-hydrolase [Candidatus Aenigmarchaeota archaeon]